MSIWADVLVFRRYMLKNTRIQGHAAYNLLSSMIQERKEDTHTYIHIHPHIHTYRKDIYIYIYVSNTYIHLKRENKQIWQNMNNR